MIFQEEHINIGFNALIQGEIALRTFVDFVSLYKFIICRDIGMHQKFRIT